MFKEISTLEAARRRAAGLSFWSDAIEIDSLGGGISNSNFVVHDGQRRSVVRIADDVEVHGIVRENDFAASRAAYLAGVAPEVLHSEWGALVLAFVEGRTLTAADVRDPAMLERIIELVRRCHTEVPKHLRGPAIMFWVFHALREYGHRLASDGSDAAHLAQLLSEAERLERAIGPIDLVFGHNDLLAANMIDDGERLWLIDWEYSGFNSPLFDLGNLASNNELGPQLTEEMLRLYFRREPTDEMRFRLAAMTAASLLRETMWSMVSETHSHLDFDYRAYTATNLERYRQAFADFEAKGG